MSKINGEKYAMGDLSYSNMNIEKLPLKSD